MPSLIRCMIRSLKRSDIELLSWIELAPEASRIEDNHTSRQLPVHIGLISKNITAVKLIAKAYP